MSTKVDRLSASSGIPAKLICAVIRQLGGGREAWDTLNDVSRGGADAGFCGFTYYRDTVAFFRRNRREIVELAHNMASELGEQVVDMVAGFKCLAGREIAALRRQHQYGDIPSHKLTAARAEYTDSVGRCLYGGRLTDDDDLVANALAWFALEEVARAHEDMA